MNESEASAKIRGIFPTPVVECVIPNSAGLNFELKQLILEREKSDKGTQHSNLGGWQSDWEFESWGAAPVKTLLDAARGMATQITCDRAGRPVPVNWVTNSWANVNRDGNGNEFHTHPGAYWSASYYVDDGGIGDDPPLGGEFEIQDPRGVAPAMLAPNLAVAMPGGQSIGASELVRPRAGLMLIFPSWLSHGVRPYRGGGVRISVGMNLTPAPQPQTGPTAA